MVPVFSDTLCMCRFLARVFSEEMYVSCICDQFVLSSVAA